ncbi:MAG: hypothetical protein WC889_06750 [Myxococcota bacterium]|jgi:hypothetical protein
MGFKASAGLQGALTLALLLAAAGCSDQEIKVVSGAKIAHPGGLTGCPLLDGCASTDGGTPGVVVKADPPSDRGLVMQTSRTDDPFPESGQLKLILRSTHYTCGYVQWGDISTGYSSIDATVFVNEEPAPLTGVDLSYASQQVSPYLSGGSRFCLYLPEEQKGPVAKSYTISTYPEDTQYPPLLQKIVSSKDLFEPGNRPDRTSITISYLPTSQMIKVTGYVSLDESAGIKIPGLGVTAVHRFLPIRSNTSITSAPANGGNDWFTLVIPDDSGTFDLEITPTPDNMTYPAVTLLDAINGSTTGMKVVIGPFTDTVNVSGRIASNPHVIDEDLSTHVTFTGEVGKGVYTKTFWTGADGTWPSLTLFEGTYSVAVSSPPLSVYSATTLKTLEVSESGNSFEIELGVRPEISGVVKYPDNVPAEGTAVVARFLGSCSEDVPVPSPSNELVTYTNSGGYYMMPLDPGLYDFEFTPPKDTYNALAVKRGLCVSTSGKLNAALPRTYLLQGTALDGKGLPSGSTVLEFYADTIDSSGKAVLLGTAITDKNGKYAVGLPDLRYQ